MTQQGCQTGDNSSSPVTFQAVLVAIETSYLSLEFGPFQGHFNLFFSQGNYLKPNHVILQSTTNWYFGLNLSRA